MLHRGSFIPGSKEGGTEQCNDLPLYPAFEQALRTRVVGDTFRPLRLSAFSKSIDNPDYMFSWYTPSGETTGQAPPEPGTIA